jgi:hypothetical protein
MPVDLAALPARVLAIEEEAKTLCTCAMVNSLDRRLKEQVWKHYGVNIRVSTSVMQLYVDDAIYSPNL